MTSRYIRQSVQSRVKKSNF